VISHVISRFSWGHARLRVLMWQTATFELVA
jgi:hypothetical protein